MIKKIYPLFLVLFVTSMLFSACGSDNDDYKIDIQWLNKNLEDFYALAALTNSETGKKEYGTISGISDPSAYILWRNSSFWIDENEEPSIPSSDVSPVFTDSITCRYEGWYLDRNNKKIIFDSTENPTSFSSTDPNRIPKTFLVGGLIDGWRVALYKMKEGDEWDIVLPYTLGYGSVDNGNIPAFTTLYFSFKLIRIKKR